MKKLITLFLFFSMYTFAQSIIAEDEAENYEGSWTNGSNGGTGFGPWNISAFALEGGFAGAFTGDPAIAGIAGMDNTAFGLYANPSVADPSVNAYRTFAEPLAVGHTFSFKLGFNWDSGSLVGYKGFILYSNNQANMEVWIHQYNSGTIYIKDESTVMFNNYGVNAMTISIERLTELSVRVSAVGRDGIETYSNVFPITAAPDGFKFYALGLVAGDQRQPYFDDLKIVDQLLPVELIAFSAIAKGKDVELNWNTASETNNYGFEVLASADSKSFTKIGFVEGAGNSNTPKNYSFKTSIGNYKYFRLNQIDLDGKSNLSKIVEVESEIVNFELSQNYPNPFNPSTTIRFSLPVASEVNLTVYNALGQEVTTLVNSPMTMGNHSVSFDASNLTSGVYFYKLTAGGFSQINKMMLIK